jgi:hypothetical protein
MMPESHKPKHLDNQFYPLFPRTAGGGHLTKDEAGEYCLEIPAGAAGRYRLAQLDDYTNHPRNSFPWTAPLELDLWARVSHPLIPGTWGFGFWNDPLSCAVGVGLRGLRLPVLPNAIWFFFASPPNYLALDDNLPGFGNLAATYRSSGWQPLLLAAGALFLPSLVFPATSQILRKVCQKFVFQDSADAPLNPTQAHHYKIIWREMKATFSIDERIILETALVPTGPLGFVLWIDNQFLSVPPNKRLSFGNLPNPVPAQLLVKDLRINKTGFSAFLSF